MAQMELALTALAGMWQWLVLLIVLVILSGFFSGSESALTALYRTGGRHLNDEKLQKILREPERLLSTILFGNNLVNISASAIATSIAIEFFGDYGPAIATGIMFFLILTFGEFIPKTIAIRYSERIAPAVSKFIWYLSIVFYPVVKALSLLSAWLAGGKAKESKITEAEINAILDIGTEQGVVEKDERELIHKVFELGDTFAKDVMTARADIVAVQASATVGEALAFFTKHNYSRLPVYERDLDDVIGIAYAKDILKHINEADENIKNLMREVYYVPESKKLDDLMQEFQQKAIQMAIVVNEHGSTVGLVTLEDILEELIGEIFDEYDIRDKMIKKIGEETYLVNGNFHIDDLSKALNYEFPRDGYDTVAGFLTVLFGRIPNQGDQITYSKFLFRVEKIIKRRIKVVMIQRI